MVSPSHYQPLRTSSEDEQLRIRYPPSLPQRKKFGTKCIRIMQFVSLSLTASCLGWVGYQYSDRQPSASPKKIETEQVLSTPSRWGSHVDVVKTGGGPSRSSSSKAHLSNKHPTLPNPDLFGTFLDQLESANQSRYVTAIPLGGINNQMTGTVSFI